eukprot:6473958-Amphidinium_carterae.1
MELSSSCFDNFASRLNRIAMRHSCFSVRNGPFLRDSESVFRSPDLKRSQLRRKLNHFSLLSRVLTLRCPDVGRWAHVVNMKRTAASCPYPSALGKTKARVHIRESGQRA